MQRDSSNFTKFTLWKRDRAYDAFMAGERELPRQDCLELVHTATTPRMVKVTCYQILARLSTDFEVAKQYLEKAKELYDIMGPKIEEEIEDYLEVTDADAAALKDEMKHEGASSEKLLKADKDAQDHREKIEKDGEGNRALLIKFRTSNERIMQQLQEIYDKDPSAYATAIGGDAAIGEDHGGFPTKRGPDLPAITFGDTDEVFSEEQKTLEAKKNKAGESGGNSGGK